MKRLFGCILCVLSVTVGLAKPLMEKYKAEEISIKADSTQFDQKTGWATATGHVQIVYGKLTLNADEVALNQENADFTAKGNVVLTSPEDKACWKSTAVKGNFRTRAFSFGPYRLDSTIWHSAGEQGKSGAEGETILTDAWCSTCDKEEPHYCLSADEVTYYDDKTFKAKHVLLKFGGVPVCYFPIFWGNTDGSSGVIFQPGYTGSKGMSLRLGRVLKINGEVKTRFYTDLMTKRGIGLGGDAEYQTERRTVSAKVYGIADQKPPHTESDYNRRFDEVKERYRLNLAYREQLADDWTFRMNLDVLSDIDMLEDWFRRDYRQIQQPKSFADISYDGTYVNFGITARPRLNDFYTVVETLPEMRFEVPRLQIYDLPFQYQGDTKIGYYSMKWRNFDRKRYELLGTEYDPDLHSDPKDYQTWRAHTQHFLYLPVELGDVAVFTPRAGIALTHYSRSSKQKVTQEDLCNMYDVDNPDKTYSDATVTNYDSDGGSVTRLAYEVGAELKLRGTSDWFDFKSEHLGINGLMHVSEPYVNYTYMPEPSHNRDYLYAFDEIDRLEAQQFIRVGYDQRLITRSDSRNRTLLRLQSYADFHMQEGDESERHAGDLGNRLEVIPYESLRIWGGLVHDMGEGDIQRGETGMRFGKVEDPNLAVRYVYRNAHVSRSVWSMGSTLVDISGESSYLKKHFESSDVIIADLLIPVNPLTSVGIVAEYDFEKSKVSRHYYELRRQLHCWNMVLGAGWDNNDFEAMVMFQLTAFPSVRLDLNY